MPVLKEFFGVWPSYFISGLHNTQVQAVLLLLGGRDVPTGIPTIDVPYNQNNRVIQMLQLLRPFTLLFLCLFLCVLCDNL